MPVNAVKRPDWGSAVLNLKEELQFVAIVAVLMAAIIVPLKMYGDWHNSKIDAQCTDRGGKVVKARDLWMCIDPKALK